jgi:hypothetical protein
MKIFSTILQVGEGSSLNKKNCTQLECCLILFGIMAVNAFIISDKMFATAGMNIIEKPNVQILAQRLFYSFEIPKCIQNF